MELDNIIKKAVELPTLEEALAYICVWENDRVVRSALDNRDNNIHQWDSCFKTVIEYTMKAYFEQHQLTIITLKERQ